MISMQISIEDQVGSRLAKFGDQKNQSRILNYIIARTGSDCRKTLRTKYLASMFEKAKGSGPDSLWNRILVYKVKRQKNVYRVGEKGKKTDSAINVRLANIYEHAGGYTIRPKNGKVLAIPVGADSYVANSGFGKAFHGDWVFTRKPIEGRQRPFFSRSFESFPWALSTAANADFVFAKELAKEGLA